MGSYFSTILKFLTPIPINAKISISCACFKSTVDRVDNEPKEEEEKDNK
jgi:hypothetical protein